MITTQFMTIVYLYLPQIINIQWPGNEIGKYFNYKLYNIVGQVGRDIVVQNSVCDGQRKYEGKQVVRKCVKPEATIANYLQHNMCWNFIM